MSDLSRNYHRVDHLRTISGTIRRLGKAGQNWYVPKNQAAMARRFAETILQDDLALPEHKIAATRCLIAMADLSARASSEALKADQAERKLDLQRQELEAKKALAQAVTGVQDEVNFDLDALGDEWELLAELHDLAKQGKLGPEDWADYGRLTAKALEGVKVIDVKEGA